MKIENSDLKSIMENLSRLENQSTRDTYELDGKRVPRVTEVLSAMLHEDGLMSWANSLGWKRISYRAFMTEAANKGTYSHMAVEKYLKEGQLDITDLQIRDPKILSVVISVMMAFTKWWDEIHRQHLHVDIVFIEETMIHDYFGGTCDLLLKVDGEYWLVDFKTSNHMSYNYSLQLAAYRFLLKELKGIEVNKCIVLMLDKVTEENHPYILDLNNENHLNFINDCEQTFMLLVAAYKMRLYTTEEYYNTYGIEKYKSHKEKKSDEQSSVQEN